MDWIAGIFELVGLWQVGNHRRRGFLIGALGNMAWIVYVLGSGHATGLMLVVVPALLINLRNWRRWATKNPGAGRGDEA